ncbi:MAG: recombinase family protein [Acidimicrobiia bacterium]
MMRCGIYVRISDVKGQPGIGVARQEKLCRGLAEKRGWTDIVVYSDDDSSAWTGKPRQGWTALLKAIEDGEIEAVIAYEPSRLYRHPRDLEPLISLADKLSIEIATVMSGQVDLSTPQGRAVARTIVAWDSYESDVKSARVKTQRDEAASNGEWQGKPRYGYDLEDGKLVINPEEAEIVRRIASEVRAGLSYRSIAVKLNDDGVPPPSGSGKWGSRKVSATLSPTVAGQYVHRGKVVGNGEWEPILTRSQYEAVQALTKARQQSGANRGQPTKHLLTGFLKCGHCGESMYYQKRGKDSYAYKCNKQPEGGCGRLSISAKVEDEIANFITMSAFFLEPTSEMGDEDNSIDSLIAEIEALEARRNEGAVDFLSRGLIDEAQYRAVTEDIDSQLEGLREKLGQAAQPKRTIINDWPGSWDTWSMDERRMVIGHVIDSITVKPGKKGARGVDLNRLDINWTTNQPIPNSGELATI